MDISSTGNMIEDNLQVLVNELEEKYPMLDVLKNAIPVSGFPSLFRNTLVPFEFDPDKSTVMFLIGPTGSGKDTLMHYLLEKEIIVRAVTATSRQRRESEAEDAYIWMRQHKENESEEEYLSNLVNEYELIEHDFHNGFLYGLPKSSLSNADRSKIILIRNEIHGARTLKDLLKDEFNIITIFLLPDSWETIYKRIQMPGQERTNLAQRLIAARDWISTSEDIVNYYLHNTENSAIYDRGDIKGIELAEDTLYRFLKKLISQR